MASFFLNLSLGDNDPTNSQWVGGPPAVVLSLTQGWWGGSGHGGLNVYPPALDAINKTWLFQVTVSSPEPAPGQTLWFLGQLKLQDSTAVAVSVNWSV